MKRFVCPICGYVHEGNEPPAFCPQCKCPGAKFKVEEATDLKWACEHTIGIPPENVEMIQDTCINSKDEIQEFAKYNKHLILVSSPTHVPRLMTLAHKFGLEAIAAPAAMDFDRNYPPNGRPIVQNLEFLRQAAYEFLGTLQYELLW